MYQTLIPCPDCARHVRATESACPFCTATLPHSFSSLAPPDTRARLTRKATALFGVAALAVTSCAAAVGPDGSENRADAAAMTIDAAGSHDARTAVEAAVLRDAGFASDEGPDDRGNVGLLYGGPFNPDVR
jgi:hypothetical protein